MNKVFEKIIEKLEEAKSNVPVNRLLDDIIKEKPKELGQLIAYNKAIEIVKKEAEKYNNGWIPCSSGNMPDDLGDVLIDMGGRQYIPAYFHNGEWYLTDCRGSSEKVKDQSRVKAWQPLPQSYQPKGEGEA